MRSSFQRFFQAYRALSRRPAATLVSLAVLALGVGAATALFSLYDQLVLKPLPVPGQERLVTLNFKTAPATGPGQGDLENDLSLTLPDLADLQRSAGPFEAITYESGRKVRVAVTGGSYSVYAAICDPGYFAALGIRPAAGSPFRPGDGAPGVVVSYGFWRTVMGGGDLAKADLRVAGIPMPVLGVAPRDYTGIARGVEPALWLPISALERLRPRELQSMQERKDENRSQMFSEFTPVARLRPGISPEQAGRALGPLLRYWGELCPASRPGLRVQVQPLAGVRAKEWRRFLPQAPALGLAVALLLLLGCLNVANLQLARWMDQRRDQATRQALGATPSRLLGDLLFEMLLLTGTGVLLAMPVAYAVARALGTLMPPSFVTRQLQPTLDLRILAFALGILLLLGFLLAGLAALSVLRDQPGTALRGGQGDLGGTGRWRQAILAVQLALSLALMGSSWGVLQGLRQAQRSPIGFQPKGVFAFTFLMPPDLEEDQLVQALAGLTQRVQAIPGVEQAGVALASPMDPLRVTLRMDLPGGGTWIANGNTVQPGVFRTLGVPLLEGRDFREEDRKGAPYVAIVNQAMARKRWPGATAVGKRLGTEVEVVGVVGDFRQLAFEQEAGPTLFRPFGQGMTGMQALLVKTTVAARVLVPQVEAEIARLDPRIPTLQMESLQAKLDRQLQPRRLAGFLLGGLSLLTALLAVSGVFGLQACLAARRRREVGLRMALGASPSGLVLFFTAGVAWPATLGLGAGVLLVLAGRPILAGFLGGLGAPDLPGLLATALLLLACACLAALPPTLAAVLANPVDALRNE